MIFSYYRTKFFLRTHNIVILNLLNILGEVIFSFFRKRKELGEIRKILVIRTGRIGDVLLMTPVLRALRENCPNAHISVLIPTLTKGVLKDNPHVDEIITTELVWWRKKSDLFKMFKLAWQLRQKKFDLGFDLRGDIRNIFLLYLSKTRFRVSFGNVTGGRFLLNKPVDYSKKHEIDANLDLLKAIGMKVRDRSMFFHIDENDSLYVENLFRDNNILQDDFVVGFHPSTPWEPRNWPLEKFVELGDWLVDRCRTKIIIMGQGNREVEIARKIYNLMKKKPVIMVNRTNLRQLVALIKELKLFICNDSSPAHFAALTKTPTIVLFGPDDPLLWSHYGHFAIRRKVECYPCGQRKCIREGQRNQCMNLISVDSVKKVIKGILYENNNRFKFNI